MERMYRVSVKDRLTNEIVYTTRSRWYYEARLRCERWCAKHLDELLAIVDEEASFEKTTV